jgi:hypothetical protein
MIQGGIGQQNAMPGTMSQKDLLDDLKRTTMRAVTYAFFSGYAVGALAGAAVTFYLTGGFR